MFERFDYKYSIRKYEGIDNNYTIIPNDAFKIIQNGNCFIIYCYLCRNYNKEYGYAFPTIKQISADTGVSNRTIYKCLDELEDMHLIKRLKFDKKENNFVNNIYRVYIPVIKKEETKINKPYLTEKMLKEIEEFEKEMLENDEEE